MKFSYLFILISVIALSFPLTAQTTADEKINRAKNAIKDLKEGVLIVRLPSHTKKIMAMEKLMKSPDVSPSNKKNLKKQITLVKQESQARNLAIVEGFEAAYRFSEVLFILDHQAKAIQKGQTKGVFLNKRLKVDDNIDLQNRPYLFAHFGKTDQETTSGLEGLILTDKDLVDLEKPFPYAVRESSVRYLMDRAFDKKNADKRNMPRLAKKLNNNLENYLKNSAE